MKAIIEFNLPEDQNYYDVANQSPRMVALLWDLSQQLRTWQKHGHDFKDANDALDKIRKRFYQLVEEHDVNIEV